MSASRRALGSAEEVELGAADERFGHELGEKPEVETLCLEIHRASIEAAETILRP